MQFLPTRIPYARMTEQIVTWMRYPSDQELLSVRWPAHATRTEVTSNMHHVEADGLRVEMDGSPEIGNLSSQA